MGGEPKFITFLFFKDTKMDFKELAEVVAINSYTKNKEGVDRYGKTFAKWMEGIGFKTRCFEREQVGNHLYFTSSKMTGKRVLLLGHLDTVFPKGTFTEFREDERWVYGPGVCDMKGGNQVALEALRQLHRQHGKISNIDMLLVSDEETGSDDSKHVTSEIAGQYDLCLVFEAAGKNHEVVVARKGVATIYLTFTGKAAHAGNHYADGCNANLAAAKVLVALTELTNLELGTTVNVGKMAGGIGANTISPEAELAVEFRFTCKEERDRVLQAFNDIPEKTWVEGVSVEMSGGLQRDVMEANDRQEEILAEIEDILGYPLPVEKRGGVSDANTAAETGVVTLDGFGPFGHGDHTVHECACKTSFECRISEVRAILEQITEVYGC